MLLGQQKLIITQKYIEHKIDVEKCNIDVNTITAVKNTEDGLVKFCNKAEDFAIEKKLDSL